MRQLRLITQSRYIYELCPQAARMLGVSGCEDGQSVASASANGSLHLWRVEYTTRGGAPGKHCVVNVGTLFEIAPP